MWSPEVRVHREVAVVWTPHEFLRGDGFSHCGMDAITMVRTDGQWRMSAASNTGGSEPSS